MKVLESAPFDSSDSLKLKVRELKLAGMKELGIPESLADSTQISFDALELHSQQGSASRRIAAASVEEMEAFVDAHQGEFILSVRI